MFENFCSICLLYYLTYCNFRKAKPKATANSGPVVSRTFPKNSGAPTLEKGCPISISARKLLDATSFNPFKRDPPPENITLLIVLLYFFRSEERRVGKE